MALLLVLSRGQEEVTTMTTTFQRGGIIVSLSDSYLTISRAKRRKIFKPELWGAFSFVLDL